MGLDQVGKLESMESGLMVLVVKYKITPDFISDTKCDFIVS